MPRSARMFEIIQMLRSASQPLRAQDMAETLEVTVRTIYRDVASLQAMRVPVEGAAGIGYIMRPGYDLPPVNFDIEEAEAVRVGLRMIERTGDRGLKDAACRAARKLSDATAGIAALYASGWGAEEPETADLSQLRAAIRAEQKIDLRYRDAEGAETDRRVLPLALVYHSEAIVLAAWCELRQDFRHFRPDRVVSHRLADAHFIGGGEALRREWIKTYEGWL